MGSEKKKDAKNAENLNKFCFCTLLAFFISIIFGIFFKVVPYQEVNLGTASFQYKRPSESIAQFPIA